jgi:hypothetical protein
MKSKKIERFSTQYQIYVYRGITVRFNYLQNLINEVSIAEYLIQAMIMINDHLIDLCCGKVIFNPRQ